MTFNLDKKFWIISGSVLGFALLLLAFKVGVTVGARKALFARRWNENYVYNFAGPGGAFPAPRAMESQIIEAHGAFGRVLKIDLPDSLVVKRPEGAENVIEVGPNTEILRFHSQIPLSDVRVDENAVIIGRPTENGRIQAGLIRLLPAQP